MHASTRKLGLHLAFESTSGSSYSVSLQELVHVTRELAETWRVAGGGDFHVIAVLFCSPDSESGRLKSLCVDPPVLEDGYRGEHATLAPVQSSDNDEGFAHVAPHPNPSVLRYAVQHMERNSEGNPLPHDQATLLPGDAARLHRVLAGLFPDFFPPPIVALETSM